MKNKMKKIAISLALLQSLSFASTSSDKNIEIIEPKATEFIDDSAVCCGESNIYVSYDDEGKPVYRRYHSDINSFEPISIFDDENQDSLQYGSNQKDFVYRFDDVISEPLVWNEMQKYFPVDSFSSREEAMFFYMNYFKGIDENACGFAVATDTIFHYFEGREDEFENAFGFPMYSVNKNGYIDFNYEVFLLKFFNYSYLESGYKNSNIDIIKSMIMKDYYKRELESYSQSEEYNKNVPKDTSNWTSYDWESWAEFSNERDNKWNELYDRYKDFDSRSVSLGIYYDEQFGNFEDFLKEHGIDMKVSILGDSCGVYNIDDIVALEDFTLYKQTKNGLKYMFNKHLGSHYIYVTGYTEDGRVIVSSWGNKFILDDRGAIYSLKLTIK